VFVHRAGSVCIFDKSVSCSPIIHLQHATERRDNSEAGSVSVFPVRIHTNLKAETLDDFERKKKGLHISAFRFRIEELRNDLRRMACDSSRAKEEGLKDGGLDKFIESIIDKVFIFVFTMMRCIHIPCIYFFMTLYRSMQSLSSTSEPQNKNSPTTLCTGAWFQSLYRL